MLQISQGKQTKPDDETVMSAIYDVFRGLRSVSRYRFVGYASSIHILYFLHVFYVLLCRVYCDAGCQVLKKGKRGGYMGGIKIKYGGLANMVGIYLKFQKKQKSATWFTDFFPYIGTCSTSTTTTPP